MRIYQAGPLFSDAERQWHEALKAKLVAAGHEPVWPGDLVRGEDVQRWGKDAVRRIMEVDRAALDSCQMVLALLDGAQVDDGTAWEIGYAYARGIPVIGIRTDFRQAGELTGQRHDRGQLPGDRAQRTRGRAGHQPLAQAARMGQACRCGSHCIIHSGMASSTI